jgi:hypothetical protein
MGLSKFVPERSKSHFIVTSYRKYTRALTFKNLCVAAVPPHLHRQCHAAHSWAG